MGKNSRKPIEQRLSIWEEREQSKQKAKEALILAKLQEQQKLKNHEKIHKTNNLDSNYNRNNIVGSLMD
jgi:hypothetical protein